MKTAILANISSSEEQLISDGLTELLIAQRKAIKSVEADVAALRAAKGDPVRIAAVDRILGSLEERRDRIEALLAKLFD